MARRYWLSAACAAGVLVAMPQVGQCVTADVTKVQQRYPWNGLVDIDYTIVRSGGEAVLDSATYRVKISVVNCDVSPAETNVAHVFRQGALPVSDGTHRVTWDANAEGVNFKSQNVKVFAEIVHTAEKYMVIDVHEGPAATVYPVTYLHGEPADGFNTLEYKGDKIALRLIPPGSFVMGSPTTEPGRTAVSEVQHPVAITKPFYIGVFEITQKQYQNVMNAKPSLFKYDYNPVEQTSYNTIRGTGEGKNWPQSNSVDGSSFMGVLRAKCKEQDPSTGEWKSVPGLLDLPTEAQWEYACRAGTTTPLNDGVACADAEEIVKQLNDLGRYDSSVHEVVGSYKPNAWGLYDMHGNAWECCLDWFQEKVQNLENPTIDPVGPNSGGSSAMRVVRSGTWFDKYDCCRSAYRGGVPPGTSWKGGGFRLAMTLP